MLKKISFLFIYTVLVLSCNEKKEAKPMNAMDTGRAFIRASLDGDFATAQKLLYNDPENIQFFDSYKTMYDRMPAEKKKNYKEASYNINKYLDVNDSTTIINYSNSYMNKPMEIKVVRHNNEWSVDFKYVTSGNLPID